MKLRKILAGAMALVMVAGSLLVGPVETKAALVSESKVYDATAVNISATEKALLTGDAVTLDAEILGQLGDASAGFNIACGDQYTLTGDFDTTLRFYVDAYLNTTDVLNWHNFLIEFVSTDTTPWIDMRADAYAWTNGEQTNKPTITCQISWDWLAEGFNWVENSDDQYITMNFKKTAADTVVVSILFEVSQLTESYTLVYPEGVPSTITAQVGGEVAKLYYDQYTDNNAATQVVAKKITWSSSNESVATVDANGKVTAVAPGTANIVATCGEKSATCVVTVSDLQIPMTGIELTTDKTEIKVGATAQLTTTIAPADTTDDKTVTYTSSNETIATVDANGKVTAVKPGTVTITATVGTFTDTVEITVPVVPVTSIDLKVDKTDLEKGDIVNVVATVNPADTTEDKTITWTSSNEKVAKVDANGTVTAVGGGNATITATIGDVKATVKFKVTAQETVVKKTEIADLTVGAFLEKQTDGVELKKGHTYTFTFKATGSDATSTNFYETACYFIYTNSENKFNTADYKELMFARGDVWCWFNADTTQNPDKLPEGATFTRTYPENWDNWVAAMKAGAECKIIVKYDGKTITATYSVADATTVASFPVTIPSGSKLYLGLTGEKVAVTDIVVADEYVKTITGTGDVNMVLPILLVMFGGAVVIVASKKRFA